MPEPDQYPILWNADSDERAQELQAAYDDCSPQFQALLKATQTNMPLSHAEIAAALWAVKNTTVETHSLCHSCWKFPSLPVVQLCRHDALRVIRARQAP